MLSSYNGRCYDSPLLKTRYRLARMDDPLSGLDHVDLLFQTRRRYRGRWENCRLATIERELLQIVREDDLPGSEAPAAWLSFLRRFVAESGPRGRTQLPGRGNAGAAGRSAGCGCCPGRLYMTHTTAAAGCDHLIGTTPCLSRASSKDPTCTRPKRPRSCCP